jgi:hypothetical protein
MTRTMARRWTGRLMQVDAVCGERFTPRLIGPKGRILFRSREARVIFSLFVYRAVSRRRRGTPACPTAQTALHAREFCCRQLELRLSGTRPLAQGADRDHTAYPPPYFLGCAQNRRKNLAFVDPIEAYVRNREAVCDLGNKPSELNRVESIADVCTCDLLGSQPFLKLPDRFSRDLDQVSSNQPDTSQIPVLGRRWSVSTHSGQS